MADLRFNPPPGWPVPPGFVPEPGWRPDPAWPPPPPGWQLWVGGSHPQAYPSGTGLQPGSWPAAEQPGLGGSGSPGHPGGTSGWAVASFVFGLLGGVLLSVVFGIIGLRRIKRTGQQGRGFAIAGLALSAAWVAVLVVVVALTIENGVNGTQPSGGTISAPGGIDPFSLKTGDCFDNPLGTTSVVSVALIPCTQAHNAQVFATFSLTGSDLSYPGNNATKKLALDGCAARNGALDQTKVTSRMSLRVIYPGASQWILGKRSVVCLVVNPTSNLTSSLLASGASG